MEGGITDHIWTIEEILKTEGALKFQFAIRGESNRLFKPPRIEIKEEHALIY
jgi:hypothetical protein